MKTPDHRYPPRVRAAPQRLDAAGIARIHSAPPLYRLFWRMGWEVPPPLLASLVGNMLFCGTFFAVLWGPLMWLLFWRTQHMPPAVMFGAPILAGVLFGVVMALLMYAWRRRRQLPLWRELPPA